MMKFFSKKKSHNADQTERGTLSYFLTSIVAKHHKFEGGHFGEVFFQKTSHNSDKTKRGTLLDF